jgi:transposase
MVLSQQQRAEVVRLHQTSQYTNREIASVLNIPRRTVDRVVQLWIHSGSTLSRAYGRLPTNQALSERSQRSLVRLSVADPQATARELRDRQGGEALETSVRTIRRVLQQRGRISYRPLPSPSLTSSRKKQRYEWAKQYVTWKASDWEKVSVCIKLFTFFSKYLINPSLFCHFLFRSSSQTRHMWRLASGKVILYDDQ